jgi:hypothetical protein
VTAVNTFAATNSAGFSGVSMRVRNQPEDRSDWMLAPAFIAAPSPP